MKEAIITLCLWCFLVIAAPLDLDWTASDWHGWRTLLFNRSGHEKGRGFVLRSGDHGRLYSPTLDIDADKLGELRLTGVNTETQGKLYFAAKGEDFREAASVRSVQEGDTLLFLASQNSHWHGKMASLRIDLNQGDGNVCLTRLSVKPPEPPGSLRSSWAESTPLAAGAMATMSREIPLSAPVLWQATATDNLEIIVEQYDLFGSKLGTHRETLAAGASQGILPFLPLAAELHLAVRNANKTDASFTLYLHQASPNLLPVPPTAPTCRLLNLPDKTTAETVWTPKLQCSPETGRFVLALVGNGTRTILADQMLTGGEVETPPLHLRFLPTGDYQVEAMMDGTPCKMLSSNKFQHKQGAVAGLPKAQVLLSGLRPAYQLNGKETIGTMEYLLSDPPANDNAIRYACQMADIMPVTTARVIFRFHADGTPDFSETDNILQSVLLRHPQQAISLCVSVTDPGPRWRERHPDEGIRNDRGEFRVKNYRDAPEPTSSMASKLWLEDSKAMLQKLIAHLNSIPAGERVVSILPCAGITWEWIHWGSARGEMVDYSTHFHRHFHVFLQQRYQQDIRKLNQAWHAQYHTFDEIPLPTPEQRLQSDGELRPPDAFQPQIDFSEAISNLVSSVILELCQCIKETTGGNTLTGTYYGYTNYILNGSRMHDGGHQCLSRLLASPYFDILLAPSRYGTRRLGDVGGFIYPDASARLHGKLLLSECDVRPSNADNSLGRPATLAGSRAIIEREFVNQLAGNAVMRWFDFSRGWIPGDPRLLALAANLAKQDENLRLRNLPVLPSQAYCAVLTSEKTSALLARDSQLNTQLVECGYHELLCSGLACAFYDMTDLPAIADKHRLFLVLNALTFTETQADCLSKLAANPRNVLWFSPVTGVLNSGSTNTAWPSQLFHCSFDVQRDKQLLEMTFTSEAEQLFHIPAGTIQRMSHPCRLTVFPRETEGLIPLAQTADGRIALAMRQNGGALLLWSAIPVVPTILIRAIAIQKGLPAVEVTPPAPVWLGRATLSVHTARPVEVKLHNLPGLPQSWRQAAGVTGCFSTSCAGGEAPPAMRAP